MQLSVADIDLFLLVFMRMSGAILFNPILGRNNLPITLKTCFSLIVSYVVTSALGSSSVEINSIVQLTVSCFSELIIGLMIGTIVSGLFSVVLMAGELIDMQMGFSMSSIYDPKSGITMPILGSFFNALLIMVFFASNAHIAFIQLVSDSFKLLPVGSWQISPEAFQFVVMMGKDIFELAIRLAIPILAVELVTQLTMGILMKAAPQINVFTVSIQLQALIGIALLFVIMPAVINLLGNLSDFISEKSVELVKLLK